MSSRDVFTMSAVKERFQRIKEAISHYEDGLITSVEAANYIVSAARAVTHSPNIGSNGVLYDE